MAEPLDSTPLPGCNVDSLEMENVLPRFLKKYRVNELNGLPSNLPTACLLVGEENNDVLKTSYFIAFEQLYVLFEYPQKLFKSSPIDIIKFVSSKQPWEDYDICIFPASLIWCIGITHNDRIYLVDDIGLFPT
jgi:hypothetical protein